MVMLVSAEVALATESGLDDQLTKVYPVFAAAAIGTDEPAL
jgi:hypothetical protein